MHRYILLVADKGMVVTNGETHGEVIRLAEGMSDEGYYEITREEYEDIMAKEAAKRRNENSPV